VAGRRAQERLTGRGVLGYPQSLCTAMALWQAVELGRRAAVLRRARPRWEDHLGMAELELLRRETVRTPRPGDMPIYALWGRVGVAPIVLGFGLTVTDCLELVEGGEPSRDVRNAGNGQVLFC
jgi:hypothetical protein